MKNIINTYDANGGTGAPEPQTYTYEKEAYVTLSSTVPTRTGYTFSVWKFTSTNGNSNYYSAGGKFSREYQSDSTLAAQWTANTYTVTYYDCMGNSNTKTVNHGYIFKETSSCTKDSKSWTFEGWSTSSSYNSNIQYSKEITITGDTTLYSYFTRESKDPDCTTTRYSSITNQTVYTITCKNDVLFFQYHTDYAGSTSSGSSQTENYYCMTMGLIQNSSFIDGTPTRTDYNYSTCTGQKITSGEKIYARSESGGGSTNPYTYGYAIKADPSSTPLKYYCINNKTGIIN